ncbi:hypothetical protein Btru_009248 [Bulinus truncatus]|nr:hypothetical protein Btru_009248 [Bulinus truncatus]
MVSFSRRNPLRRLSSAFVLWKFVAIFAAYTVLSQFLVEDTYEDGVGRSRDPRSMLKQYRAPPNVGGNPTDPHSLPFTILPNSTCSGRNITLVIFVFSHVENFNTRHFIRKTWGSYALQQRKTSVLVFIVGFSDSNYSTQYLLEDEAAKFGDILQVDFLEHYKRLSLKSVSMLKWVSTYCPDSQFVLKVDDDVYVNVPWLVVSLKGMTSWTFRNDDFVFGGLVLNKRPHRNRNSKWYTSRSEFNGTNYPPFVAGPAYAMNTKSALRIYAATREVAYFWLEDVYITGMCAEKARVKVITSQFFSSQRLRVIDCNMRSFYAIHGYRYTELPRLHEMVHVKCSIPSPP